jgi:hypothetical protein
MEKVYNEGLLFSTQGDALTPLFFNFTVEHAIRSTQANQKGLKLNGTQLLVYADGVTTLCGSIQTIKTNTDVLVIASKGIGLKVIARSCLSGL